MMFSLFTEMISSRSLAADRDYTRICAHSHRFRPDRPLIAQSVIPAHAQEVPGMQAWNHRNAQVFLLHTTGVVGNSTHDGGDQHVALQE